MVCNFVCLYAWVDDVNSLLNIGTSARQPYFPDSKKSLFPRSWALDPNFIFIKRWVRLVIDWLCLLVVFAIGLAKMDLNLFKESIYKQIPFSKAKSLGFKTDENLVSKCVPFHGCRASMFLTSLLGPPLCGRTHGPNHGGIWPESLYLEVYIHLWAGKSFRWRQQ